MMELLLEQAEHWHIYLGIIVTLILTGCGLPIPEEIPIVAAGVLSAGPEPTLHPVFAFVACMFGALVGDSMMYLFGRLGRPLMDKYAFFGKLFHVDREQQMEQLIRTHGLKVFFVARFMIGVRAPMYMAAGMMRVPWRVFILVDGICATVVVGAVFLLSMIYGDEIASLIHEYQVGFTILVGLAVLVAIGVFLLRRRRGKPAVDDEAERLAAETEQTPDLRQATTPSSDRPKAAERGNRAAS